MSEAQLPAAEAPPGGTPLPRMAADLAAGLWQRDARLVFGVPGGGANLDVVGAAEAADCGSC